MERRRGGLEGKRVGRKEDGQFCGRAIARREGEERMRGMGKVNDAGE